MPSRPEQSPADLPSPRAHAMMLALHEVVIATEQYRVHMGRIVLGIGATDLATVAHLVTHGPSTPTQIARAIQISTPSVTELLDRLTQAGLALRLPHPTDRRKTLVELTPTGHAAAHHIQAPLAAALARSAATLTTDEHTSVLRFLRTAATELHALTPTTPHPAPTPQADQPITGSRNAQSEQGPMKDGHRGHCG